MASMGMSVYFINSSTEQTDKISFKAAGVKYKEHFTVSEVLIRPDMPTEQKQRKITSSSASMRDNTNPYSTDKNSLVAETENVKEITNSTINIAKKRPVAKETIKISTDLQVLSSFDCVKSIPTVLLEYISNTFLNEYGRSHEDFHSSIELKKQCHC